jgi:hypothetical protein
MALAPVENKTLVESLPPLALVEYVDPTGVGPGEVSDLIILNLYGLNPYEMNNYPPTDLSGDCYAIDLASVAIACNSTNYTFRIFTAEDPDAANTINEILVYDEIELSMSDVFQKFIARNRDVPLKTRLYAVIENNSAEATGPIYIELIFTPLDGKIETILGTF